MSRGSSNRRGDKGYARIEKMLDGSWHMRYRPQHDIIAAARFTPTPCEVNLRLASAFSSPSCSPY